MSSSSVAVTAPSFTVCVARVPTSTLDLMPVVAASVAVVTGAQLVTPAVRREWILVS